MTALADRPLFLVANEFFDALPIRQYVKTERGWCERMVTATGRRARISRWRRVPAPAASIPPDRAGAPEGGVYEISPAAHRAGRRDRPRDRARRAAAALIVDYGYDAPRLWRNLAGGGRSRFADVLDEPGESDLSAHVDFAALAAAAREAARRCSGRVTQGAFLADSGHRARGRSS